MSTKTTTTLLVAAALGVGAWILLRNRNLLPTNVGAAFVGTAGQTSTVETPIMFNGRSVIPGPTFSNFDAYLKYESDYFHNVTGVAGSIPYDLTGRDAFASYRTGLFT